MHCKVNFQPLDHQGSPAFLYCFVNLEPMDLYSSEGSKESKNPLKLYANIHISLHVSIFLNSGFHLYRSVIDLQHCINISCMGN